MEFVTLEQSSEQLSLLKINKHTNKSKTKTIPKKRNGKAEKLSKHLTKRIFKKKIIYLIIVFLKLGSIIIA